MKFFFFFCAVDLLFVCLHVFFGSQFDLLNLDRERTPAALFSAIQFIGSAFAAAILFMILKKRSEKILFSATSFLLIFMAFDEIAELHENVAYYLVQYIPSFSFFGSKTAMWLVFLSPVIVGAFIMLGLVVWKIIHYSLRLGILMGGGLSFFGLALLLEFFGNNNGISSMRPYLVPLEEGLELLGGTLLLGALSSYATELFHALYQRK